jgi:ribosomal protein S18 acetylase RimI-like enzyme
VSEEKIVIRKATAKDEAALVEVLKSVKLSGESWTEGEEWVKNTLRETPDTRGFAVLVAEYDHKIVGFMSYVVFPSFWECSRQGMIVDFFVSIPFQGKGVGSRLVEAFKAAADAEGLEELHVSTGRKNTETLRFYRKHGFTREHLLLERSLGEK